MSFRSAVLLIITLSIAIVGCDSNKANLSFNNAISTAHSIQDSFGRASVIAYIAITQAKAGKIRNAIENAGNIKRTVRGDIASIGDHALSTISIIQAEAGYVKDALKTAHSISNTYSSSRYQALVNIAITQAKADNINDALSIARSIDRDPYRGEALRDIAIVQAIAGNPEAALETIASINLTHTRDIYYYRSAALPIIASCQAKAGDFSSARVTFTQALLNANNLPNDDPERVKALHNIAVAQAKVGDMRGTLDTIQALRNATFNGREYLMRPKTLSEASIASAKAGYYKEALELANLIIETVPIAQTYSTTTDEWRAIQYYDSAVKEIVIALAKSGNTRESLEIARYTHSGILKDIALAQAKEDTSLALEIALSIPPSPDESVETIGILLAKAGYIDAALELSQGEHGYTSGDVLIEIGIAQANNRELVKARQTFNKAIQTAIDRKDVALLRRIALIQSKLGQSMEGRKTFAKALETAFTLKGPGDRDFLLADIARDQAEVNEFNEAIETALKITSYELIRDSVLHLIAVAQANGNYAEGALETAAMIRSNEERAKTFADIGLALCKSRPKTHEQKESHQYVYNKAIVDRTLSYWRLYNAIKNGDLSQLKLLITRGATLNVRFPYITTLLHIASDNGNETFVNLLLDNNANINAINQKGETALHIAAASVHEKVVKILIDRGANVNAQTVNGNTALHLVFCGGIKIVSLFGPIEYNVYRRIRIVELLLKGGAYINHRNIYGHTPLGGFRRGILCFGSPIDENMAAPLINLLKQHGGKE